MIARIRQPRPLGLVLAMVPLAGVLTGSILLRTEPRLIWLTGFAYLLATVAIAANLALEYVVLQLLIRVLKSRGSDLLRGVEPMLVLALLAIGTCLAALIVLATVRFRPALAALVTGAFPGLTLLAAMAAAAPLDPARRQPARRGLVLVFATQFLLTLAIRVL